MNDIYDSIWSEALSVWIAISEIAKGQSKRSSNRRKLLATGLLLCTPTVWALPTGDSLVAGQAIVNTPDAGQMQIDQTSQKAIVNWQKFSIAPNEIVNIHQPNAQAALLNRVVGQDASQIQGQLTANGQVYLVNPNGVIFDKTAQVDVGGLIASTHNIKDADFLNGHQHFTQDGATGTINNEGSIKTPEGGIVALIGTQVSNSGTINTPKGTTALVAGKTVDLDFQGDGLIEVKVTEATLNGQVNNRGAILADGGRVVLTAKATGQLIDTVINQDGIIRAQGLVERNGEIILDGGDNGMTQLSGTLNTDGQTGGNIKVLGNQVQVNNGATVSASGKAEGGTIVIGNKQTTRLTTVQQGASVTAQTLESGKAGTIDILANMDSGTVNVAGQLNASAPQNGDGGFIDTSAAHVNVADSATISTKSEKGKTGTWLIDPFDFTVAASGGDITGATLSANLVSTNVNLDSIAGTGTTNGFGDVHVNDEVNWSANILTLRADRNININANLNGSGTAQLKLHYGRASATGGANDNYFINKGAKVTLSAGANFSTIKGYAGNQTNYTVITDLGAELDATTGTPLYTTLQGIAKTSNLGGNYILGSDIDASLTSGWNSGAGFTPIGTFSGTRFTGLFDGLGHTISSLMINSTGAEDVGLFGNVSGGTIRNVGLINANVTMTGNNAKSVGALVGYMDTAGGISNSYAMGGIVTGYNHVGGLVGYAASGTSISYSYSTNGTVTGNNNVGGLVGYAAIGPSISYSYSTNGTVTGNNNIGGLLGVSAGGHIDNSYATDVVTGNSSSGGLVGLNSGVITRSFWDTQTTLQATAVGSGDATGATGSTTAEMMQASTFAAWNISSTGGSSAIWRIYEGSSTPLLRSFLTPLSAANNITKTYNGLSDNTLSYTNTTTGAAITPSTNLLGTAIGYGTVKNVGTYLASTAGLYSNQQGYDISAGTGTLTINPALLTLSTSDVIKGYDGSVGALGTATVNSGTLFTGDSLSGGVFAYTDKNAGSGNKTVTTSGVTVNDGNGGLNYLVSYLDNTTSTINPALLTLSTSDVIKGYDGSVGALGTATVSILRRPNVNSGTLFTGDSLSGGVFAYTDKNVGSGNKTVTTSGVTVNDGNGGLNYLVSYLDNTTSTINPALLTLSTSDVIKGYDGSVGALGTATVNSGTLFTGDSLSGGVFAYTDKNAGSGNKTVTTSGVTVNDGNGGLNYLVSYLNNTTSTINRALLTLSTSDVIKVYDGSLRALGTATVNSGLSILRAATVNSGPLFTGDSLSGGVFAYTDKNVGSGNKTVTTSGVTVNDGNGGLNYFVSYLDNTTSTINRALLTLNAVTDSKVYDGSTSSVGRVAFTGLVGNDTVTGATQAFESKDALGMNGSVLRIVGYTLSDGNNGGNYIVTTTTAAGTIEAAPLIKTTVTATSPVTAIIEAVPPATELAANIATANLNVIGIITQYQGDNASITKVAIVNDPTSDRITMVIIDQGAINKGDVGVTNKNVDSLSAMATVEQHNTVEKQTAPASTDSLTMTKQDTPSKTQTASPTPHQSNTKATQSTPSSIKAKSTNSSHTTQKNALAPANNVNSQSTATTKTQLITAVTSTTSNTQQKSVLSVSTVKKSLNNANSGNMVTALKNSLTDAAVSKGASPRQAEQASSLFVKSLVNNIAKGMPISNATALAQQAFNAVVNAPKTTPTQTASASSGMDNQLSQAADAHTASGSAAFKAVLNSSLAKGMSLEQAAQSAQNAAQNADTASSSPKTTTTLASSNTDANNSLSQLAGTRTASGSATFEAVFGAGLAKGQSPVQSIQTALTAAQTVEAGEKADNSPQGNLANDSMRSSAFTNKSVVFQNTLNVALTKGVPIDQALQRATVAANADQVVMKAEASNVKFMLAANSSTLANSKGDFANVLGNAIKRGDSVKQAMEKALEADKQQQQRIKADANNPTLGFSTSKMQLPEKSKNFDRVLRAAIRHGLTPAEALIKTDKTLENQPTELFTPALSFATGNKLDTLLPADKHSLLFDGFLNKALSRGDTINEALDFAKRAESIVKNQQ